MSPGSQLRTLAERPVHRRKIDVARKRVSLSMQMISLTEYMLADKKEEVQKAYPENGSTISVKDHGPEGSMGPEELAREHG